jgi:hypothetical protein
VPFLLAPLLLTLLLLPAPATLLILELLAPPRFLAVARRVRHQAPSPLVSLVCGTSLIYTLPAAAGSARQ